MSIRIVNGYKISTSNLDEVILQLKSVKKEMLNSIGEELTFLFIQESIELCEYLLIKNSICPNWVAKDNKDKFLKDINKDNSLREIYLNYQNLLVYDKKNNSFKEKITEVNISIYPIKFYENNMPYYLFTFHGENRYEEAYIKLLQANNVNVSEYYYWDHTDKDDNVSDDNWEKRSLNWKQALETSAPFADGLVLSLARVKDNIYNLSNDQGELSIKLFNQYNANISKEKRIDRYVRDIIIDEMLLDLPKYEKADNKSMFSKLSEFSENYNEDKLPVKYQDRKLILKNKMTTILNIHNKPYLYENFTTLLKISNSALDEIEIKNSINNLDSIKSSKIKL